MKNRITNINKITPIEKEYFTIEKKKELISIDYFWRQQDSNLSPILAKEVY